MSDHFGILCIKVLSCANSLLFQYFKVSDDRSTRKTSEIYSKLTIKIPERCQWYLFDDAFIVNFEYIALLFLVLLLQMLAGAFTKLTSFKLVYRTAYVLLDFFVWKL